MRSSTFSLSLITANQPGILGDATQKVTILDDDEATFGGPTRGGLASDLLLGTRQADVILGGGGSDTLRGGDGGGGDTLKDGGGADLLNDGGGADVLNGGGVADTLTGKGGDDTIVDFKQGQDKIQIQSGARTFEALTFDQDGRDVLIGFGSGQVRVVTGNAGTFDENDFIF